MLTSIATLAAPLFCVNTQGIHIARFIEIDGGFLRIGKWESFTQRITPAVGEPWMSNIVDREGLTPTRRIKVGRWEMSINRVVKPASCQA